MYQLACAHHTYKGHSKQLGSRPKTKTNEPTHTQTDNNSLHAAGRCLIVVAEVEAQLAWHHQTFLANSS